MENKDRIQNVRKPDKNRRPNKNVKYGIRTRTYTVIGTDVPNCAISDLQMLDLKRPYIELTNSNYISVQAKPANHECLSRALIQNANLNNKSRGTGGAIGKSSV